MLVDIEEYRGFQILFDTDTEKFQCFSDDCQTTERSFSDCKKLIDNAIKNSDEFIPFWVERHPLLTHLTGEQRVMVIGKTESGQFIIEQEDGTRGHIPRYSEREYILWNRRNEPIKEELRKIEDEKNRVYSRQKAVLHQIVIKSLIDFSAERDL